MFHWNISDFEQATFWAAVLEITVANILLSGDNAVIIAMACRALPRPQRTRGIAIGAAAAVLLRVAFTGVVARLLELPYVKIAGGLALLYIAARLLVPDDDEGGDVVAGRHLWHAVRIIVIADIVMSFDNVLAIVQIAGGNGLLLIFGLGLSVPLVIVGAAFLTAVLDRFPILVWVGSALLGWVGGQTIVDDNKFDALIALAPPDAWLAALIGGCTGAALALVFGGVWRRWRLAKSSTPRDGIK
ncbi:MAG: YjbE family putative metal transport protein [Xanthobacteraceae bacterium]|jgi:YjbE family integral membrane protein